MFVILFVKFLTKFVAAEPMPNTVLLQVVQLKSAIIIYVFVYIYMYNIIIIKILKTLVLFTN